MEKSNQLNAFACFDQLDCPQKLESFEQVTEQTVDDSWFLRKSNPKDHIVQNDHTLIQGKRTTQIQMSSLSPIKEKENRHNLSSENMFLPSSTRSTQSPPSPVRAAVPDDATACDAGAPPRLATESRCQQRSKWELLRQQRERLHEQLRQQRKESICRREQHQVQQLRAAAVPKAHPIRHYKPLRIHRSEKPLTVAKSPDFALSRKDRNSQSHPE